MTSGGESRCVVSGLPRQSKLKDGRSCLLRLAAEDDAEELCQLIPQLDAETDFLTRFPGEFDKTVEQEREFIREHGIASGGLAVVALVEGRIVGLGGAMPEKLRRYKHRREFGLCVLKSFWRQGIGREITGTVVDSARQQGLRKLALRVVHHNSGALALYKSFGFVEEGRLLGDVLLSDGSYGDTLIMAKFLREPEPGGDS